MSVDRISAPRPAQPLPGRGRDGRDTQAQVGAAPRPGLAAADGEALYGSTAEGAPLRLAGLARFGRELLPGDVLMLRVLQTEPQLELELFGSAARSGAGPASPAGEPAAMRLDQVVLRQLNWQLPDAFALATTWRAAMLGQGGRASAPPAGTAALPLLPGPVAEGEGVPAEHWTFPFYAWGGVPAMLRVVHVEDEDAPPSRGRSRALVLRLELNLPGLGEIVVLVQSVRGGVLLTLAVARAEAVPLVRKALPALGAAIAAADLRLQRVSLVQAAPAAVVPVATPGALAAMPAGLFRAMAEALVVLLSCSVAADGPGAV